MQDAPDALLVKTARTIRGHRRAPDNAPDCTRMSALQKTGLRAFGLLDVDEEVLSPQRIKPKHFTIL